MLRNITTKIYLKWIESKGFVHGRNFNLEKGANIDSAFCKYISVGHNVTLAKDVYILAHDASMKKKLGKTKIGNVIIGNNVFIGARTVILPGVRIGNDTIIAANSTVTRCIPDGQVWGETPAKYIMDIENFLDKHSKQMIDNTVLKGEALKRLKSKDTIYID